MIYFGRDQNFMNNDEQLLIVNYYAKLFSLILLSINVKIIMQDTIIEFYFTKININNQTAEGFFLPFFFPKKARTFYLRSKLVALN